VLTVFKEIIQTALSARLKVSFMAKSLSKSRMIREQSLNGEIHIILPESKFDENSRDNVEDFNEAEIRQIMKKEASKPLLGAE
jgi:hypothetical protein